jgi:hypothetical protein
MNQILYITCNMPTGILLELGDKGTPGYEKTVAKGANEGTFDRNGRFTSTTVGGYGLTEIPADFYYRWKAANMAIADEWEDRKLLVVHETRAAADDFRKANGHVRTGFEPIDPETMMPKGLEAAPTGAAVDD